MSLLRRVIGGVLRRLRVRQGRTLREVAAAAGVSMPYLSEVERGRKEASSEVLAAICRALGIRLSDLLGEARDDLRRLERTEPMGFTIGGLDRAPGSGVESDRPSVRAGLPTGAPTSYGNGRVELRLGSSGLSGGVTGLTPIGPAPIGVSGGPGGDTGLRVRLVAVAQEGRPTARSSWRTRRVRARRRRASR